MNVSINCKYYAHCDCHHDKVPRKLFGGRQRCIIWMYDQLKPGDPRLTEPVCALRVQYTKPTAPLSPPPKATVTYMRIKL